MSWKEAKVEPSPGSFPVSEAEIKRQPDLKDLYQLAVSSLATSHLRDVTSAPPVSPPSAIVKCEAGDSYQPDDRTKLPSSHLSSVSRSSSIMPFISSSCDSSSSIIPPSLQIHPVQRRQVYDNPAIIRSDQPSSTRESPASSLMPPPKYPVSPAPARDMSRQSLESQLMPPPAAPATPASKVIVNSGAESSSSSVSAAVNLSNRVSSNFPGQKQEKEDIGKNWDQAVWAGN